MKIHAVGLLSPGDMGHVVGQVLIAHGLPVWTCLKGRSARTRTLTQKAHIQTVPTYEELLRHTDLILSILVPAEAENAALNVVNALHHVKEPTVYVDCNAISPISAHKIATLITNSGSRFVSVSIVGPPPSREGTTRFYASGLDVETFETLGNYGLEVFTLGSEIEQAKGFKMAYAALTKGMAAISTELLIAAKRMGLYDALVDAFQARQSVLYQRIARTLPSMPTRSRRWIGEMEEIATTFEALGLTPKIYQGIAELYRFIGRTSLAEETPETLDRNRSLACVIEILAQE